MKLTIYTVVNYDYFDFAEVFISSLKENYPDEKLNKIIINDLGLSEKQSARLREIHSKVEYIKTTQEKIRTQEVHTDPWREAINQKTLGLEKICNKKNYPILMVDSDMKVLKDFSDEIFSGCDIQVCSQPTFMNDQGYLLDYIGCWFVIHNEKGKLFIDSWKKIMPNINSPFLETPALCEAIRINEHNLSIKINYEENIANVDNNPNSKIFHFRSSPTVTIIKDRIKGAL